MWPPLAFPVTMIPVITPSPPERAPPNNPVDSVPFDSNAEEFKALLFERTTSIKVPEYNIENEMMIYEDDSVGYVYL